MCPWIHRAGARSLTRSSRFDAYAALTGSAAYRGESEWALGACIEYSVRYPRVRSEQIEISPERTTNEANAGNVGDFILEEGNFERRGPSTEFVGEFGKRLAVVLVVARHIDDRLMGKGGARPLEPFDAVVDVASQHNDVGLDWFRTMMLELAVQIAYDVDAGQE